jgi:Tfp pilus assembly major pilin PilA
MIQKLAQTENGNKMLRQLVLVASIGVVGYILYSLYKKSKKKDEEKTSTQTVNAIQSEIQQIQSQGGANAQLSWPQSRYVTASNTIQQLLDGCEMSQSELKAVEEVATVVKKPIDWLNLVKTFGVRQVDNCGIGTGDTTYDLPTLLKDQLDSIIAVYSIDINGYKKTGGGILSGTILRNYLASKGVNI